MGWNDYLVFLKRFKWTVLCFTLSAGILGYVITLQKSERQSFQVKLLPQKKETEQLFGQQTIGIAPSTAVHIGRSKAILQSTYQRFPEDLRQHFSYQDFISSSSLLEQDHIVTAEIQLDLHTRFGPIMVNTYAKTFSEHLLNLEQEQHRQQLHSIEFSVKENIEERRKIKSEIRLLVQMDAGRDNHSTLEQAHKSQQLQSLISERHAALSAYDAQLKELKRTLKLPSHDHTITWLNPQQLNRLRQQQTKLSQLKHSHLSTSPKLIQAQNELNVIEKHLYGHNQHNVVYLEETPTNRSLYAQINTIKAQKASYHQALMLLLSQKNKHLAKQNAQDDHIKNALEQLKLRSQFLETFFSQLQNAKVKTQLKSIGSTLPYAPIEFCYGQVKTDANTATKTITLFAMGGFAFSLLFCLGIKVRRHAPSSKEDLQLRYGKPVLGELPWQKNKDTQESDHIRSKHDEVVAYLKHNIETCGDGRASKTIFICSPSQNEGKSTIANHLAKSFANDGNKTLLISADLRKAMTLTENIDVSESLSMGFGECLAEKRPIKDGLYPSVIANLDVVPNIRRQVNPSRQLASPHFDHLFDSAKQNYDTVIVDTPAILAVVDACSCAPKADCVVFVALADKTRYEEIDQALDRLNTVGVTPAGFVLNGAHGSDHQPTLVRPRTEPL